MKIFHNKKDISAFLSSIKNKNQSIGFVPTMGALHEGHISLIHKSKQLCDITVVSIFVNPTQFNNEQDLLKYPKPIENDIEMLKTVGCAVLFNPSVEEMYTENEYWDYKLGFLNTVLEGAFRPGHYEGVTQIVFKLFDLVKPDFAFFGQKDYQQYMVIKKMVQDFSLGINLIPCEIIREQDGLAMSSRNIRLSENEREKSLIIHKSLNFAAENFKTMDRLLLLTQIYDFYNVEDSIDLEYFKICDKYTLRELSNSESGNAIALVACLVGATRLIDNMILS